MNKIIKAISVLVSSAVLLGLSACSVEIGPRDLSQDMLTDPVMMANFDGLSLIDQSVSDEDVDSVETTNVTKCMGVQEDSSSSEIMKNIVNFAQTEDWKYKDDGVLDTSVSMIVTKEDKTGDKMLLIVSNDGEGCQSSSASSDFDKVVRISITY